MMGTKPIRHFNKENESTSINMSELQRTFAHQILPHTHHYEIFPYTYNSAITMNGELIDRQSYNRDGSKYKVIYNGNTTIVILEDGTKGVAKRNPKDRYDKYTGYLIAIKRARIKKMQRELEELIR